MEAVYIAHSCFLIVTGEYSLLFDYPSYNFLGELSYKADEIVRRYSINRKLFILFSHSHYDHFNPEIIGKDLGSIETYTIVSVDTGYRSQNNILVVEPRKTYRFKDLVIKTYRSTDQGVAYLVNIGDKSVFHSGDYAKWLWPTLPEEIRFEVEKVFWEELTIIMREKIHVAFIVAEPELPGWGGAEDFILHIRPRYAIPIHLWGNSLLSEKFKEELQGKYPETIILSYRRMGEVLKLGVDNEARK